MGREGFYKDTDVPFSRKCRRRVSERMLRRVEESSRYLFTMIITVP